MDKYELKTILRNKLLQIDLARPVSKTEITLRCIFCGDSIKNPRSTHLYIKLDTESNEPVLFQCFRCNNSGILTPSVLRNFQINDLQLNSGLIRYNKSVTKNYTREIGIKNNDFQFIIPRPKDNEETEMKREYINDRLGLNLSVDELIQMKTIFHLGDFLRKNDIEKLTTSKDKAKLLHENYVGFLSARNEFINFRNIYEDKNKRWEKYSIFQNLDNTRKFYTIPNQIDLLTTNTVNINIAEGVFDIFGIYHHIFERETENMIYTAVCGSGYISVLKYFIQMGIIGNVNINIFSDKDKDTNFYKRIGVDGIKEWVDKVTIYYNELSKDCGVKKDKIRLTRKKL